MNDLKELREKLDSIDAELMRLYSERMEAALKIAEYKRENSLPVEDISREAEVLSSRTEGLPQPIRAGGERLMRLLMEESKKLQRRGLNLYLIGMPDCGKTRTGRKLKNLLGRPLLDTDLFIEKTAGRSIESIFSELGEEVFRDLETEALRSAVKTGGLIVAAGGGLPMRPRNAELMRGSGMVVFLDRSLEALHGQSTAGRPLIAAETEAEVNAKIDALYHARRATYLSCADLTVDPDSEGAAERIAEAYIKLIDQWGRF